MKPEKVVNSATQWPVMGLTRRVGVLASLAVLAVLMIWGIDESTVSIFLGFWNYPREYSSSLAVSRARNSALFADFSSTDVNLINVSNVLLPKNENPTSNVLNSSIEVEDGLDLDWISVEFDRNYSVNLLSRWLESSGGEPCKESKTAEIKFTNFDDGGSIVLSTGGVHEVVFQALDELGDVHCQGGDYFEIDLSGESWKSRPPIKDFGNGTYSFLMQVHPDFAGDYILTVILLFRHFEGLKFSTARFGFDKELRRIPILFPESRANLPKLEECRKSDFNRDVWAGRWTRHAKNDDCEISNDGRFRCLDSNYTCTSPWCNGSLGLLESNGWVYSAHCSFRILSPHDAWNCLNNRWLFFWGDSNHVDTIRNILYFFLAVPFRDLEVVSRRFDRNFTNPTNTSQSVRITNVFNGHWNQTMNYQGLNSLSNEEYRRFVKGFFNGSQVPDTVILNSGLHDGIYWHNVRRFIAGAKYAASFWEDIVREVKNKGLNISNFIFRSTITTGGYARTLAFNPSKMEAFNGILLDKLRSAGLVTGVIDDFDMTWAWHFDNRCNDGVHYGRFPAKMKWRDGQIGHQYFVDLMLGQVLLNTICTG